MAIMALSTKQRSFKNSLGHLVDPPSFKATEAKNSFGVLMEAAEKNGIVKITKRNTVRAVLLSVEEYDALTARLPDPIAKLQAEFDALLAEMQTPKAKKAARSLFQATPHDLGRAAARAARRG